MRYILLCAALAGCGTVPLGYVYSEQNQLPEQRKADIDACSAQARADLDTPERVNSARVKGATLVGLPGAIVDERTAYRELFRECITARGYRWEPPK